MSLCRRDRNSHTCCCKRRQLLSLRAVHGAKMQIQPASVRCKGNPFSYVVTMLKLVRNNRGVMHKRTLIAALIIIAISLGISQYQKHGILGFILGFSITVVGIVAAVFVLIGLLDRIGYLHDRLHKKAWRKNTLKIS